MVAIRYTVPKSSKPKNSHVAQATRNVLPADNLCHRYDPDQVMRKSLFFKSNLVKPHADQ